MFKRTFNIRLGSFLLKDKRCIFRKICTLTCKTNSLYNSNSVQLSLRRLTMAAPWIPCRVGASVAEIDTPALVIDLDRVEENHRIMRQKMEAFPNVALRPHIKSHKCPALAMQQLNNGAIGVCCQTLTETESMVNGGVMDVLLTNQVIGKPKLRRFVSLCKRATVSVLVECESNVRDLNEVAGEFSVKVPVVVEVNVGFRCGTVPGEPTADLVNLVSQLPNLHFKGLHCYNGVNQHVRKSEDRRENVKIVCEKVETTLKALSARGIKCDYITGGGTGSFQFEGESNIFTEIQPGSYIFMDADYSRNLGLDGKYFHDFKQSLFVLSTVQSVTEGQMAVVDCGMKGVSLDSGVPLVYGDEKTTFTNGGDEHGILSPSGNRKVGDLVWLIPGHCDPTANLYDWLIGLRNGRVESVWPITGRGPGV